MNADDPRHGSWAGYNAGCRSTCCREAARRYQGRRYHDARNGRPRMLDITGTRRRIRALMRIGWSAELIAQHAGVGKSWIQSLSGRATLKLVHRATRDRIARVYDELSGRPGPSREVVKHAIRLGYVSPLAWEYLDIDDPNAEPVGVDDGQWRPAGYDESRVERRINGDRTIRLHKGESAEVVRRMLADGISSAQINRLTGIKVERYVKVSETRQQVAA